MKLRILIRSATLYDPYDGPIQWGTEEVLQHYDENLNEWADVPKLFARSFAEGLSPKPGEEFIAEN